MLKLTAWTARPVYKRLLVAAIVIYILGSTVIIADLCRSVGKLEHELVHVMGYKHFSHGEAK